MRNKRIFPRRVDNCVIVPSSSSASRDIQQQDRQFPITSNSRFDDSEGGFGLYQHFYERLVEQFDQEPEPPFDDAGGQTRKPQRRLRCTTPIVKVAMKVKYSHARQAIKKTKAEQQDRWKAHINQSPNCAPCNPLIQYDPEFQGAWGRIHQSHQQGAIRNLVFCRLCGYIY